MESTAVGGLRRTQPWPTKSLQEVPIILVEEVLESQPPEPPPSPVPPVYKEHYDEDRKEPRFKGLSMKRFLVPDIFLRRTTEKSTPDLAINGHILVNHNFKKATFCDACQRLLVAGFQRNGLRCKICKANLHATCTTHIEECQGHPMGSFSFSRQVSTSGQSPSDESCFSTENKVDSVYQVLKEGIILRSCKDPTTPPGSLQRNPSTESGVSASKSDPNIPGSMARARDQKEPLSGQKSEPGLGTRQLELRTSSNSLNEEVREESPHPDAQQCKQWLKSQSSKDDSGDGEPTTRGQLKAQQMDRLAAEGNLYVALYKYEAQQRSDLSLKPGDKVVVTNDKDQSWWIGECDKRNGFFPANFVMGIRPTEQIHNCIQPTTLKDLNNREIPLKKHQVLAIRYDWPVSDHNYVYARSPNAEGYVCKEDLKPL